MRLFGPCILAFCLLLYPPCYGHGGVAFEQDVCVIKLGFLKAHFTLYQPSISGSKEFCEDVPEVAESIFVLDYLHDFLREMPVDFRIIKDVNDIGVYANWDDVENLEDIDRETVFYQPPVVISQGVFKVAYRFQQPGSYIGIVTAQHPTREKSYHAVFHFQVGGARYGYVPYIIALLILLQILYWLSTGGWKRWRRRVPAL